MRERQLDASDDVRQREYELPVRAAWARLGLRERELATWRRWRRRWHRLLPEHSARAYLGVRERQLVARFGWEHLVLHHHSARAGLGLRQWKLATRRWWHILLRHASARPRVGLFQWQLAAGWRIPLVDEFLHNRATGRQLGLLERELDPADDGMPIDPAWG